MQLNCCKEELQSEVADATTKDDSCFDNVLPPVVHLADYVCTGDVAVPGQLTEDDIIQEVTGGIGNDDSSEDDDCGELHQSPESRVKEPVKSLSLLEEYSEQTSHGVCAMEHLAAIGAIITTQVDQKRNRRLLQTLSANKGTVCNAGANTVFLLFIQYCNIKTIQQFFAVPSMSNQQTFTDRLMTCHFTHNVACKNRPK